MTRALTLALALTMCAPALARAQAPPSGDVSMVERRARALFEDALVELREGRAAAGRDLLRASLSILPTVSTRYNLAVALRRTGEVTEARFILDRLLEDELTEAQRARVSAQRRELGGQIATLVVHVPGAPAAARVEVDGIDVGQTGERPLRVQVDPGRHRVAALHAHLRGVTDVRVGRGAVRDVTLTLAPFVELDRPGPDPWPWIVTAAAVVLAGVAIGVVLHFTLDDADAYPTARTFETLTAARF